MSELKKDFRLFLKVRNIIQKRNLKKFVTFWIRKFPISTGRVFISKTEIKMS
jgi:hypothetical protein